MESSMLSISLALHVIEVIDMAEEKKISEILEDIASEMCDHYCKYPIEYKPEEHDGVEIFDSDICRNCPLVKYF